MPQRFRCLSGLTFAAVALLCWAAGCDAGKSSTSSSAAPRAADAPNVLWIVWDTLRPDRMGVYNSEQRTTPYLDALAAQARVYTNCVSPGSTTAPAHASMFTGLMPSEHGSSNEDSRLSERWTTIAELFRDAGYGTFCYAENPHITRLGNSENFVRGFQKVVHPWDDDYYQQAVDHVRSKLDPEDQSTELTRRMSMQGVAFGRWNIKTGGPIGRQALESWLDDKPSEQPWFVFMNFMDAHRHLIPARQFREKVMTPEQMAATLKVDRTWDTTWRFVFGVGEYTEEELELTRLTYDATLLELDHYFGLLIDALRERGELENTVIVLTSDHGEHLGDHHLLDHQFSVYQALLHVPLIVHYPREFSPGRDDAPVQTSDLFPTLLNLAGIASPAEFKTQTVDLRSAAEPRGRLGEYPRPTNDIIARVEQQFPRRDFSRFRRELRAYYEGQYKLICGSDGSIELFDYVADPYELRDLATEAPDVLHRMKLGLAGHLASLTAAGELDAPIERTPEELQRLQELGYVGDSGGGFVTIENACAPDAD